MPPENRNICDFSAFKRRKDAALRVPPMEHSGRRDPDGRPAFDPDNRAYRDAVAHLREVLVLPNTPDEVRASIAVVLDRQEDAA